MRKNVPHAKCSPICAIKESLQALWARAGNCINKVNDVSPDGDGNFSVTGGDNVVIGSTQNGITIDTTGAVAYYTTDDTKLSIDNNDLKIATVGVASTADVAAVAADVTAAEGDILTLQGQVAVNTGDIVTETTNRQNADNALSAQISAVNSNALHKTNDENFSGIKTAISGGTVRVPTEATGSYTTDAANSTKVRNEIYTYALTTTQNQNYTGIKTLQKTSNIAVIDTKITDVSSITGTIYLSGTVDANNQWMTLDSFGKEADPRQYYNKRVRLQNANFDIRMWVDESGNVAIGIFNPILGVWHQVVLQ